MGATPATAAPAAGSRPDWARAVSEWHRAVWLAVPSAAGRLYVVTGVWPGDPLADAPERCRRRTPPGRLHGRRRGAHQAAPCRQWRPLAGVGQTSAKLAQLDVGNPKLDVSATWFSVKAPTEGVVNKARRGMSREEGSFDNPLLATFLTTRIRRDSRHFLQRTPCMRTHSLLSNVA